jgi:hypothetical protein
MNTNEFADNNPMLRDGVTGDWYALLLYATAHYLYCVGLVPSLDTKAPFTKPDYLQMLT